MKPDIVNNMLLSLSAISFLFGAAATVLDVVLRATTGGNLPSVIELTTLSIGFGALLSIPVCYRSNTHVTARLLSELRPALFEKPLGFLGNIFSIISAATLALIMGRYAIAKWGSPETTPDMQLPMNFLLMLVALAFWVALLGAVLRIVAAFREAKSNG